MNTKRIAFFLPNLFGGGAEKVTVNLLKGMSNQNLSLDLILAEAEGPYLKQIPEQVRVVNLATGRVLKAIPGLSRYLQEYKPYSLISHISHTNVAALLARELSGIKTRLVLVEHNTLSDYKSELVRSKFVPFFMKWLYPRADVIVGVSQGVTDDLRSRLRLSEKKVTTVYNPVIDNELLKKAKTPLNHPWFQKGAPPVFLAVGRLTAQKDFATLIKAFALLRKQRLVHLAILGEGECRTELEGMTKMLGVSEDVSLPGFVDNPYRYMYNANAFVLSSRWEGLPTVLIEAMACGCPVVATDCPSGPREILADGKYGVLVPVGDAVALSEAMLHALEVPRSRDTLAQQTQDFSVEQAVANYLALLD